MALTVYKTEHKLKDLMKRKARALSTHHGCLTRSLQNAQLS